MGKSRKPQYTARCTLGVLAFLCVCCSASLVSAQVDVKVSVTPEKGTVQDVFELSVVVQGSRQSDVGTPVFAPSREFTLKNSGTAVRNSFAGGVQHAEVVFSFQVMPEAQLKPGVYELPAGQISIAGRAVKLAGARITIVNTADVQRAEPGDDSAIGFVQLVDNTQPYAGQQITYRAEIAADQTFVGGTLEDIDFKGFWREQLPGKEKETRARGNITIRSFLEVLTPKKAGAVEIPTRYLLAKIRVPRIPRRSGPRGLLDDPFFGENFFDNFPMLSQDNVISKRFAAAPLTLQVKPLPPAPVENPGYIPVGKVKLVASVDKKQVTQGESVTVRIIVSGDANLKPLEIPAFTPEQNKEFKRYDDTPEVKTALSGDKILQTKTFKIALVPLHAGVVQLPVFKILSFDPQTQQYETLITPAAEVQVEPSGDEQRLQISGPGAAAGLVEQKEEDKKRDITIVAEDLLPQHVGAYTFAPRKEFPRSVLLIIVIFLPLAGVWVHYHLAQKEKLRSDPALILQRNAFAKACSALAIADVPGAAQDGQTMVEVLRTIINTYLNERFRTRVESLTPKETAAFVSKKTRNDSVGQAFVRLFELMETALYSGARPEGMPDGQKTMLREAERLIAAVEDAVGGKRK